MDCEKFESALMDELYGELDELTSAAAKRHVSGCARCAALLGGLRATRRVAALPRVEPPPYLEQRILDAAAAATPRVVPLRGRLARAVSLAGSWAMRPQTAMAAVFLVMIGTSVLLLRGKSSRAPASAEMTVTEEGTPAPAGPSAVAAVAATETASVAASEPVAMAHADRLLPAAPSPTAMFAAPPAADMADDIRSRSPAKAAKGEDGMGAVALNGPSRGSAGAAVAAAAAPPLPPASPSPAPVAAGGMPGGSYASAPEAEMAPAAQAAPADPSDELWAARTARDAAARQGRPCPSGARFDDVASRAPGSQPGWDALFEGALCYESLGEFGSARTRLGTLLGVPSYRDRARYTLDRINKEQQGGGASAARAAAPKAVPAAPAAPPAAPASPPSSDMH
jgi:hypothetical protein